MRQFAPPCAALVFIVAMIGASISPARAQDTVVRVGVAAPLTGPIAHLGRDMELGARLAIDELNQRKVVIGGRVVRFEAQVEDDRADPASAVAVAQKLADQRVNGVVGHLNSGTTIPAAKIYNDAGIPQVAPAATNPTYTRQGYAYAQRLMATDLQQASGIAQFVGKSLQAKLAVVVDDRTAYGQGLADEVIRELGGLGVKVLSREFTTDRATDFAAIVTAMKAARPDVVVFAGADAQAGIMNRQMKQLALDAKFIAGDGVCTGKWSELAAGTNEGYYCTQAGAPRDRMGQYADFERRFKSRYNTDVVIFAPYAYDAVMVLAQAMKAANSTDPAVYAPFIRRSDVDGVIGKIRFDQRGDNLNGTVTVYRVTGGKLNPAN